jgi:hypothetical protein
VAEFVGVTCFVAEFVGAACFVAEFVGAACFVTEQISATRLVIICGTGIACHGILPSAMPFALKH